MNCASPNRGHGASPRRKGSLPRQRVCSPRRRGPPRRRYVCLGEPEDRIVGVSSLPRRPLSLGEGRLRLSEPVTM